MLLRSLVVLHRYMGVVLGVLMTLWCLSGFVMMYQSFPALSPAERLAGLAPLPAGCCDLSKIALPDGLALADARMEMSAEAPVLRLQPSDGPPVLFDIASGQAKAGFSEAEVLEIARAFGEHTGIGGTPRDLGVIEKDQWTVQVAKRNAPVHHIAFDDPRGAEIYVSGATGEVFLDTNRKERVLSWLGAIPHWLYPTILREYPKTWSQVVIWTSTLGVFLTATGLYVGIAAVGRLGRVSPYKGLWFWHHMTGLVFGVLTLTWVFSGLLTMNPWGLFESGAGSIRGKLAGQPTWAEVKTAFAATPPSLTAVQVVTVPWGGTPRLLVTDAAGEARLFNAAGVPAPLGRAEVQRAFALADAPLAALDLIETEDAYYYGHHGEVPLPAWRARLADAEETRVYIDPKTGRVVRAVDAAARGSRWLSSAPHDFDLPVIRQRPIWDLVVLTLLLGVTASCAIGTWMSFSRVGRDVGALRRLVRRRREAEAR